MGVTSSNLCCYCHEHHGLSCRKTEKTNKERNRRTEYCKRHQCHESPNSSPPYYSAHCDNDSVHSYYQEISCFCPSRCRRFKNKPKKSQSGLVFESKRSSFVFHDPYPSVFPSGYCRTRTPPFPLDIRLSSHSSSNEKRDDIPFDMCVHSKEYEIPYSPSGNQRNTRRSSDLGSGMNSKRFLLGHRLRESSSCVPVAEIRQRGIPPFPIDSDNRGDKEKMSSNHPTYIMSTTSASDRSEWVKAISRAIRHSSGGGIFGQELSKTIANEHQMESKLPAGLKKHRRHAPYIVEACCQFIRQNNGFNEEGLFRLPGQANDVKVLQDSFDKGERPTLDQSTDAHTVASLIKSFLRELPEPLIPYDLYHPLLEAAKMVKSVGTSSRNTIATDENLLSEEAQIERAKAREIIKKNLKLLPQVNFELLRYLCNFLDEVQQHSSRNKMDIANLAVVFAPNILRSRSNEPMTIMSHSNYVQYIMSEFIANHLYLFPHDEEQKSDSETKSGQTVSLPDVAADAASKHNQTNVNITTTYQQDRNFTDTVVSSQTTQATSTDGFNTMTTQTTTSPPGTIGFRHITDDSGTGSLGPTPDNTSKRPELHPKPSRTNKQPTSAIIEESTSENVRRHSGNADPSNKPALTKMLSGKASYLNDSDINRRESFYDNVTHSSESSAGIASKNKYRIKHNNYPRTFGSGEGGGSSLLNVDEMGYDNSNRSETSSDRSSYANQSSPAVSSPRLSTNAVAGSSVHSGDVDVLYSPSMSVNDLLTDKGGRNDTAQNKAPKPPVRKRRSKKAGGIVRNSPQHKSYLSDEESNTESLPPDDSSDVHSILSSRPNSRLDMLMSNDVYSPGKNPARPNPPPYPSGHPRANKYREQVNRDKPSYTELEEAVRMLEEKLRRKDQDESKWEQVMKQLQELRQFGVQSSQLDDESLQSSRYWRPTDTSNFTNDSTSYMGSNADTVSEAYQYNFHTRKLDIDSKATPKEFRSTDDHLAYLQKCVQEERTLRQLTEIQLKNEKRGRIAAEQRNAQLEKEMRDFFQTFGCMFSNEDSSGL